MKLDDLVGTATIPYPDVLAVYPGLAALDEPGGNPWRQDAAGAA